MNPAKKGLRAFAIPASTLIALIVLPALTYVPQAQADDGAVARGHEIADAAWEHGRGFGDLSAQTTMTIITRAGQQAEREMRIQILELPGEAGRALTVVDAPRDVRGTALLTHTDDGGAQEQWLFLPATQRTRRISSENRGGSFMGSEFSFDDFSAQTPSRYRFRHLRDEECEPYEQCHVLHREEIDGLPGHQIVWMDSAEYRLHRVEFYDARGDITRVLTVEDHRQVETADGDRYWRAHRLRMENQRTGAASELAWDEVTLGVGLSERDFDVERLGRRR